MSNGKSQPEGFQPDLFDYLDHIAFLKDLFAFKKQNETPFSKRKFCESIGISPGSLANILSRKRNATSSLLIKICKGVGLNRQECRFLVALSHLKHAKNLEERRKAYNNLLKFRYYSLRFASERNFNEFLRNWHYLAIREMAQFEGFQLDAKWIQLRLSRRISLTEIRMALKFLIDNKFITLDENGNVHGGLDLIDCRDVVTGMSAAEHHTQMLQLASEAIFEVKKDKRKHEGRTIALSRHQFDEAKKILSDAMNKIQNLTGGEGKPDSVYQFSVVAFPLAEEPEHES